MKFSTMESCNCCRKPISNADFVSCAGSCKELFHIKCVAVTKQMLNAVNACPNIHWHCNECNNGNRSIAQSLDQINDAIDLLRESLSGDLIQFVNGFTSLTETFIKSLPVPDGSTVTPVVPLNSCPPKNDDVRELKKDSTPMSTEQSSCKPKTIDSHCTTAIASRYIDEPVKSVVVSNIGKDITGDFLSDYIADKLVVAKERINLTLLLPAGKSIRELNFLQFKVTVPDDKYDAIMCPGTWPENIHVRDFVYKEKNLNGVSKQHFFLRHKCDQT